MTNTNLFLTIYLVLFCLTCTVYGQQKNDLYTVNSTFRVSDRTINIYTEKLISQTPTFIEGGKAASIFQEVSKKRADLLIGLNNNHQLMGSGEIVDFVQDLTNFLVESNSNIFKYNTYKVFLRRSSSVNASNLGEGIILINTGLLARVKNVEQLAFVIAHELSHDVKKHADRLIENSAILLSDNSYKKQYKSASKKKYGSFSESQRIYFGMMATLNHYSRKNEIEADSLGLIVCSNAGIDKIHAIELLKILDKSDELAFSDSIDLKSFFSTAGYIIEDEDLTQGDLYSEWKQSDKLFVRPDSLKTHPDCQERIFFIDKMNPYQNNVNNGRFFTLKIRWSNLHEVYLYEYIHTLIEEQKISEAQYYAICLKGSGYDTPFINGVISYCFLEYYEGIKTHNLAKKLPFPDIKFNDGFNSLLEFLHNQNSKKYLALYKSSSRSITKNQKSIELNEFASEYAFFLENKIFTSVKIESNYFSHPLYLSKIETLKTTYIK